MNKNFLLLVLCLFAFHGLFAQQNLTVSGKVTDATSGQPLIAAAVQVKGTTRGAQTDLEGNYTIADVPANATLVASSRR